MSLKTVPIIISLVVSTILLFGGWMFHQEFYVKKQITGYIESLEGTQLIDTKVDRTTVQLTVSFTVNDPSAIYAEIEEKIGEIVGKRQVHILFPEPSDELKRIWAEGYFELAEAMELKQYSRIPSLMEKWEKSYGLSEAMARMDDRRIMIILENGDDQYIRILPLTDEKEVTANG